LLTACGGAGTCASQRGHRGSLREMSTYRKQRGHAAATIPPPPEGESHPSPCSTAPSAPPRRFTEDVVTDDEDGDAPPRSNRARAVFTFSIVHTLWYVVVAGWQGVATGNRFRSLGHACFGREDSFPGCAGPRQELDAMPCFVN
jgi:hypothetical protein